MPIVLYDTNVLMDVLLDRQQFIAASSQAWALASQKQVEGRVAAITLNNLNYLVRRELRDRQRARDAVKLVLDSFGIVPVDRAVLEGALLTGTSDFEDAIQHVCAVRAAADLIVTRNPKHFPPTPIRIVSPEELLQIIASSVAP